MSGIRLKGTGSALPRQVVTNRDLQRIVETDDAWIVSRTGIRERRKCRDETQSSLAEAAARAAMEMAGIGPETVGVCLVPTITADYITPSTACVLQNRLGLPEDTVCFDLNAACSGFVYGLHTAQALLAASPRKYGLVVCSEVLTRITNYTTGAPASSSGTGAAAVWSMGDLSPYAHGAGARGPGTFSTGRDQPGGPSRCCIWRERRCSGLPWRPYPGAWIRCWTGLGWRWRTWMNLSSTRPTAASWSTSEKMRHPAGEVWMNMDRYGNVSSASTALALDEVVRAGGWARGNGPSAWPSARADLGARPCGNGGENMKLNELLGTEFPFIQGGMANIATGAFAAAVSNAGALA